LIKTLSKPLSEKSDLFFNLKFSMCKKSPKDATRSVSRKLGRKDLMMHLSARGHLTTNITFNFICAKNSCKSKRAHMKVNDVDDDQVKVVIGHLVSAV
jgi:hypothetical protein